MVKISRSPPGPFVANKQLNMSVKDTRGFAPSVRALRWEHTPELCSAG
jgi:hypothetical protein